MRYNDMHNIVSKNLVHTINDKQKAYVLDYNYDSTAHPNAPNTITEVGKTEPRQYAYDGNGNPTAYTEEQSFRKMTWDEENRLMGINDNGRIHQYTYDAAGERIIKSSGGSQHVSINGETAAALMHTDDYTAYVSAYFVISKGKFTKHYFEGAGRIVSKLGTGSFAQPLRITAGGVNYTALTANQQMAIDNYVRDLGMPPGPPTQQGIYATPEFTGDAYPTSVTQPLQENEEPPQGWPRNPAFNAPGDVPGPPVQFGPPVQPSTVLPGEGFTGNGLPENDIFYYHPDHLGSTSYITDKNGAVSQHVEYIAFGEVLFEEHSSSYSSPYLFNGKELDRETNLSYYGARYLDMKTSLWLSVDPLATYNPIFEDEFYFDGEYNGGIYNGRNLSYYGYCYQSPILFYDPNGKQSKFWTRTVGALQMVGGTVEAIVGGVGGVVTAETGVGAVIGYAVLMNGIDNATTGAHQLWTGESQTTMLHKGVKATATAAGASESTAENLAIGADISTVALGGVNSINALNKAPKAAKELQSITSVLITKKIN